MLSMARNKNLGNKISCNCQANLTLLMEELDEGDLVSYLNDEYNDEAVNSNSESHVTAGDLYVC